MRDQDVKRTEERQHFRIDVEAEVTHYVLPENATVAELGQESVEKQLFTPEEARYFEVLKAFKRTDNNFYKTLSKVSQTNRDIAECLRLLNEKFGVLAKQLVLGDAPPTQIINLSLGGMAFKAAEEIAQDARVKLKVILLPSYYGILCSARVIACRHLPKLDPALPYKVAVQFADLTEADKQVINRYIMQQQVESLQARSDGLK